MPHKWRRTAKASSFLEVSDTRLIHYSSGGDVWHYIAYDLVICMMHLISNPLDSGLRRDSDRNPFDGRLEFVCNPTIDKREERYWVRWPKGSGSEMMVLGVTKQLWTALGMWWEQLQRGKRSRSRTKILGIVSSWRKWINSLFKPHIRRRVVMAESPGGSKTCCSLVITWEIENSWTESVRATPSIVGIKERSRSSSTHRTRTSKSIEQLEANRQNWAGN